MHYVLRLLRGWPRHALLVCLLVACTFCRGASAGADPLPPGFVAPHPAPTNLRVWFDDESGEIIVAWDYEQRDGSFQVDLIVLPLPPGSVLERSSVFEQLWWAVRTDLLPQCPSDVRYRVEVFRISVASAERGGIEFAPCDVIAAARFLPHAGVGVEHPTEPTPPAVVAARLSLAAPLLVTGSLALLRRT